MHFQDRTLDHIVKPLILNTDAFKDTRHIVKKDNCSILMHFQATGHIVKPLIFNTCAFKATGHIVNG